MTKSSSDETLRRKKDHLDLCINGDVTFIDKTNGFEQYDFRHFAVTDVNPSEIDLSVSFFNKIISFPFLISCMTGGPAGTNKVNIQLAEVAEHLNIPLGLGSERYALEDEQLKESLRSFRQEAPNVPILSNIGAAQIVQSKDLSEVYELAEVVAADAFVIHLNPLQEILQKQGEPVFVTLLEKIEKMASELYIPIIAKEVGSGISKQAAKLLLDAGVQGIDVAGSGGTSWAAVELQRNHQTKLSPFTDWGLPTSYCIRTVKKLKSAYDFMLIGSGGINSGLEAAKALALGSDIVASARIILKELHHNGIQGTIDLIKAWFEDVKICMYLTGTKNLKEFNSSKLISKRVLY